MRPNVLEKFKCHSSLTRYCTLRYGVPYLTLPDPQPRENEHMGAWAEDTFGNDTACDWIRMFLRDPGLPAVKAAIETVLETDDYLDSDPACDCLAACEVLARLQGKWGVRNAYSKDLDKWVESNPAAVPADLKAAADAAIERILGSNSELPELWDEGGPNADWHKAMDDLRKRVRG